MATNSKLSTRDRLLAATATLTYTEGVGVGVQALCQAAGVSKRSLYQLFASKDDLVAESLRQRAAGYAALFLPPKDDDRSPRERILHVFEQLATVAGRRDYRGCPYLAAQVEIKDIHNPAFRVARKTKRLLTDFFRAEAQRGGAEDPALLARQLMIVFDGAAGRAGIGADTVKGVVTSTAAVLLDAAGVR
ncbi:TetR/AcrR family transcriptional regulator [Mycolicibacterium sp.]|uniref:TetR/AcrR family transcriptional regulator n=1 Tax=Mycolicibacterium sp. TaxID=2320850 RepID=UPI003D0A5CA6